MLCYYRKTYRGKASYPMVSYLFSYLNLGKNGETIKHDDNNVAMFQHSI